MSVAKPHCIILLTSRWHTNQAFIHASPHPDCRFTLQSTITALFGHFVHFDQSGDGRAAAIVRPLFVRLLDHIEMYCRNPPSSQLCSTVEVAAAAAVAEERRHGRKPRVESASHAVYDDLARIADALQRLSVSHFGRAPGRAVDQVPAAVHPRLDAAATPHPQLGAA